MAEAAIMIQAMYRGAQARKKYEAQYRNKNRKKGNKYDVFRVNDVRAELGVMDGVVGGGRLPGLPGGGGGGGRGFEGGERRMPMGLAPMPQGPARAPARLAPLGGSALPKLPSPGGSSLPALPMNSLPGPPGGMPMPPMGGRGGLGGRPMPMSSFGTGFNPPPRTLGGL